MIFRFSARSTEFFRFLEVIFEVLRPRSGKLFSRFLAAKRPRIIFEVFRPPYCGVLLESSRSFRSNRLSEIRLFDSFSHFEARIPNVFKRNQSPNAGRTNLPIVTLLHISSVEILELLKSLVAATSQNSV